MERVAEEHPAYALAASSLAGLLRFNDDQHRSRHLLGWVFSTGKEPAADPFVAKYLSVDFALPVVNGVTAQLRLDRSAIGLALAELHQEAGDLEAAIDVVEQLEPTTFAALSLAELYSASGRYADVVELTDDVTNIDDATALLCVFRGVALREQGYPDAARAAFKEAMKSTKRVPVIRHRALLERARTYEAQGKRAMARKDLERIMADDSDFEGLAELFSSLE